ncbi:MAG: cytochrome P450 [Myxococcales bacterium]|nr:cytochrome P450 [Myxococcales bacterium]
MALPPGPKGPPMLLTMHWLRRPFEFLEDCQERFGEAFTFRLPQLPPLVVFSNPEVVKTVFAEPGEALHAGAFNQSLSAFLGDKSVLMVDGAAHMRKRKLLMPPFHGERMLAYGDLMMELADDAIDALPEDGSFSLHERMNGIALDVIIRSIFGVERGPREREMKKSITELLEVMTWPPLLIPFMRTDLGPLSPWGRALRLLKKADDGLYEEIRARRVNNAGRQDILSLLVDARDEEGKPMEDTELRDELVTLLVAGHETTATALTWAMRWVLADPIVEDKLRSELDHAGELTPQKVQSLPYLDATAREALRLCPVIPIVGRILREPMTLGGCDLPAGVGVVCSIYLAHRRPEAYEDPTRFWPDRFLQKKLTPAEWFPFGGGIRRCIGMAFALFEMKMVLARLFRRTRMKLDSSGPIKPVRRSITLMPSEGLRVKLLSRVPREHHAA